jgi:hypothetical protein
MIKDIIVKLEHQIARSGLRFCQHHCGDFRHTHTHTSPELLSHMRRIFRAT